MDVFFEQIVVRRLHGSEKVLKALTFIFGVLATLLLIFLSILQALGVFSFILLKDHGIITIPAVSMPGASATIRFDLSTNDAFILDLNDLCKKIESSINKLQNVAINEDECREIVF